MVDGVTPDQITERLRRVHAAVADAVFSEVTAERALAEADRANQHRTRRRPSRPLDGVTVAWKDVFDVAGCLTRAGTRFLDRGPAERDHPLVARLAGHGAVCVGKTSLSELAVSALGENDAQPAPVNPHDGRRVCGGSSSGAAAAVSRDLVDVGFGTDCGGSVRLPAAWCGVVGFKPSWRQLDRPGLVPFSPSLDVVGVLASSVRLVADAVTALAPGRPGPTSPCPAVLIGRAPVPSEVPLDPRVAEVYESALAVLARAGIGVPEADCDPLGWARAFRDRYGSTAGAEGVALWRRAVVDAGDLASPRLRRWFQIQRRDGSDGGRQQARQELIARFRDAVPPGVVLVTPTSPIDPPLLASLDDEPVYDECHARANALLWPFNELDAPAISIPCGYTDAGIPVGLQLVAPSGRDADVLAAAVAAEAMLATRPDPPMIEVSNP